LALAIAETPVQPQPRSTANQWTQQSPKLLPLAEIPRVVRSSSPVGVARVTVRWGLWDHLRVGIWAAVVRTMTAMRGSS
jgi:hypothetical protein